MRNLRTYWWIIALAGVYFAACNNRPNDPSIDSQVENVEWKTGVALYSFHTLPFKLALEKADSGNLRYVEGFSFYKLGKEYNDRTMGSLSKENINKMKEQLKQRNLKMVSMYVSGGNNLDEWKNTFEMAKEFGLEYITCEPLKEHWNMIDSLAGIYKIKVAVHNHWKEISTYWHPDSVLAAIKGRENFGACADIGHWVRSGLDPAKCLEKLNGQILGIHLKDVDESGNPKANDVTVGTGVIDFVSVVNELKRQDYNGMVYVECEHDFGNNLSDIIHSINHFNNISLKNIPTRD